MKIYVGYYKPNNKYYLFHKEKGEEVIRDGKIQLIDGSIATYPLSEGYIHPLRRYMSETTEVEYVGYTL